MIIDILITVFLVLLNGFFVAAEFAIVKVRLSEIETGNNQGGTKTVARHILNNLDSYLAATQLGITIASIGLGWIGERVVEELILDLFLILQLPISKEFAHQIAFPVSFMTITFFHVVFGELAPKSLAIRYSYATTMTLAMPLRFFFFIFRPFIWLFNGFANILLRALNVHPAGHDEQNNLSEAEIKHMIESQSRYVDEKKQKFVSNDHENVQNIPSSKPLNKYEILTNVFTFDDKSAKSIMVPRIKIASININDSLEKIVEYMNQEKYSRYPVYKVKKDNIIGFVHFKDIWFLYQIYQKALKNQTDGTKIKDKLDTSDIRQALFVPTTKRLGDLLEDFQKKNNQLALVTDEFGVIAGLITMEDIIEEMLGEIYDEHDVYERPLNKVNEDEYIAQAVSEIEELNRFLPYPLPAHDEYDTLSGYLLMLNKGDFPKLGEEFENEHYKFTIARMSRNRILLVMIRLLDHLKTEQEGVKKEYND